MTSVEPIPGSMRAHVPDRERRATDKANLGMWVFLTTETLFFGVLFFAYIVLRIKFPDAFAAASRHTDIALGTINTIVLLTSSVAMALGVRAAALDREAAVACLGLTVALGIAFLAIKGFEYGAEYHEHLVPALDFRFEPQHARGAELFFWLYFVMTGFHGLHLAIGIAVITVIAVRLARNRRAPGAPAVEVAGLYWHFVDIVWIFVYPCLYLVSRS